MSHLCDCCDLYLFYNRQTLLEINDRIVSATFEHDYEDLADIIGLRVRFSSLSFDPVSLHVGVLLHIFFSFYFTTNFTQKTS